MFFLSATEEGIEITRGWSSVNINLGITFVRYRFVFHQDPNDGALVLHAVLQDRGLPLFVIPVWTQRALGPLAGSREPGDIRGKRIKRGPDRVTLTASGRPVRPFMRASALRVLGLDRVTTLEARKPPRGDLSMLTSSFRLLMVTIALSLALIGRASADELEDAKAAASRGDHATAARILRSLAEQGHAGAQAALGLSYRDGLGVEQDHAEAARWLRKAAEQGDADAQGELGALYLEGMGVRQDYAEAVKWSRRAAEQGDREAQYNLGLCYLEGHGVGQSEAEAVAWFRRAAEQGFAEAQYNLARAYDAGVGLRRDAAAALPWYRAAAEQGLAPAQFNLGVLFDDGDGVPEDDSEAASWYRRAAEQGYPDAQLNLGILYATGSGVARDPVLAYQWFELAVRSPLRDRAAKNRQLVERSMTLAQIDEAERLVREWKAKPETPRGRAAAADGR